MLSPFGIALRKLRLDHGLRLLDLARLLGQSPAYISAIETGKKPIPVNYVQLISVAMKLSAAEQDVIQIAADRTFSQVSVQALPADQRELVAAFARTVDTMSPEVLEFIRKNVHKSVAGDIPFKRRRRGLLVGPTSTKCLRQFSEQIRAIFIGSDRVEFPVMDVIEFKLDAFVPGYFLEIGTREEMGNDEGRVIPGRNSIMLREDVYEGACNREGRHRFTAAHELAHFLMHRAVVMARMREDHHKIFCDAEWQADEFAGSLLMSGRHASSFAHADDAARQCGMSPEAARVMLTKHRKEGSM